MWHIRTVSVVVIISATLVLASSAMAGESKFVFVPQADSPGNDYLRVENSSLEDCEHRCDALSECNAFTYNQLHSVCSLKRSAHRMTEFYAFAITGIRLSPSVLPTASDFRKRNFLCAPLPSGLSGKRLLTDRRFIFRGLPEQV